MRTVIGGHPVSADKRNLDKPGTIAVLVGTPGRLVDHIGDDKFKAKMGELKMIVLDEADNLDMGFKKPLDVIFGATDAASAPDAPTQVRRRGVPGGVPHRQHDVLLLPA